MAGRRLLLSGYNPVVTIAGDAVSGAKAYFFENDTSTPKTVYQDAALTVPHAHPVVADGDGVLPSIFADEDEAFSFSLRDANDAPILGLRDLNDLYPTKAIGDGLLNAGPFGQDLVSADDAAAGQTVLEVFPNAADVVADGSTDNASALQAATAGGASRLPRAASAYASGPVTVSTAGAAVVGDPGLTAITKSANGSLFTLAASNVTLGDLAVTAASGTTGALITLSRAANRERFYFGKIRGVNLSGLLDDSASTGGYFDELYVRDIISLAHRGRGIHLRSVFAYAFFDHITIDYNSSTDADANYTAYEFDCSSVGAGDAGGLYLNNMDVLGTANANTTSQHGFVVSSLKGVQFTRADADVCGGYGYQLSTVQYVKFDRAEASLCALGGFLLSGVTDASGNVEAIGRSGLPYAPANAHGLAFVGANSLVSLSISTYNNTGAGVRITGAPSRLTLRGSSTANTGPDCHINARPYGARVELDPVSEREDPSQELLLNGCADVWQAGTTINLSVGSWTHCADMWRAYAGTGATSSVVEREPFSAGDGPATLGYDGVSSVTAFDVPQAVQWYAPNGSSSESYLEHMVERVRLSSATTITLIIWINVTSTTSSQDLTLTPYVRQDFGPSGSADVITTGDAFTVTSADFGAWRRISFEIDVPSVAGKTINDGNFFAVGLRGPTSLGFDLITAAWTARAARGVWPVQRRPFSETLAQCQRYFYKTFPYPTVPAHAAGVTGAWTSMVEAGGVAYKYGHIRFPIPMARTPTISFYNPVTASPSGTAYFRNLTGSYDTPGVLVTGAVPASPDAVTFTYETNTALASSPSADLVAGHIVADARFV